MEWPTLALSLQACVGGSPNTHTLTLPLTLTCPNLDLCPYPIDTLPYPIVTLPYRIVTLPYPIVTLPLFQYAFCFSNYAILTNPNPNPNPNPS